MVIMFVWWEVYVCVRAGDRCCICFPNEDVVLRHTVVNALPLLITPRLFSVLGCQRIFFLNYSVFFSQLPGLNTIPPRREGRIFTL